MLNIKKESNNVVGLSRSRGRGKLSFCELRLINDIKALRANPFVENIQVLVPDENHYDQMVCTIVPDIGYWKGQTCSFQINWSKNGPKTFPMFPPSIVLSPGFTIFHPNIDTAGGVCLGLHERGAWKVNMDIRFIATLLYEILKNPTVDNPLNPEAAKCLNDDPSQFALLAKGKPPQKLK